MAAAGLSSRDYHDGLALVSEAAAADGTQPFERPTIEGLLQVIPADRAGYFEYSNGGEAFGTANTFFVDAPFCATRAGLKTRSSRPSAHGRCVTRATATPPLSLCRAHL